MTEVLDVYNFVETVNKLSTLPTIIFELDLSTILLTTYPRCIYIVINIFFWSN